MDRTMDYWIVLKNIEILGEFIIVIHFCSVDGIGYVSIGIIQFEPGIKCLITGDFSSPSHHDDDRINTLVNDIHSMCFSHKRIHLQHHIAGSLHSDFDHSNKDSLIGYNYGNQESIRLDRYSHFQKRRNQNTELNAHNILLQMRNKNRKKNTLNTNIETNIIFNKRNIFVKDNFNTMFCRIEIRIDISRIIDWKEQNERYSG